jgi:DNA-binding NtrC family response regulator
MILIVDDRAPSRAQIRRELQERGFEAMEASDGDEGWRLFQERRPSAVITDMRMPGSDGMDLLEKVRGQGKTPVFCITAYPEWEASAAAIKRGASDYYQWPRDLDRMLEDLEASLRPPSLSEARSRSREQQDVERQRRLEELIRTEGGNVTHIADKLGVDRKTVYAWCRRFGIRLRD